MTYLNYITLGQNKVKFELFGKKIDIFNPYTYIKNLNFETNKKKQLINLNYCCGDENEKINCFDIEGAEYNGILFNYKYLEDYKDDNDDIIHNIKDNDINGILLYSDGQLICRLNQAFLGDIRYFIKKIGGENEKEKNNFFKCGGYINLPKNQCELMINDMEIKDQALFGFPYHLSSTHIDFLVNLYNPHI